MLFQELVEQHLVHGIVADRVRLSVLVGQYERGIYLRDFFRNETKLRCFPGVVFEDVLTKNSNCVNPAKPFIVSYR
jgi:hypothetical protein